MCAKCGASNETGFSVCWQCKERFPGQSYRGFWLTAAAVLVVSGVGGWVVWRYWWPVDCDAVAAKYNSLEPRGAMTALSCSVEIERRPRVVGSLYRCIQHADNLEDLEDCYRETERLMKERE